MVDVDVGWYITTKKESTRKILKPYVDMLKYEKNVSECNKLRSLIQILVVRNTNIISQKE